MGIPVLVTGGAGYIGSHVCKALKQDGFFPITLDNLSLGHKSAVKWGPLIQGDISDQSLVKELCVSYHPVGLIHLAALSNVRESHLEPLQYYKNNVKGTIDLLDATKGYLKYIVFSSTCATYGLPTSIPILESHPQNPISPYGQSKWIVEQILKEIAKTGSIQISLLRYFNAAGADPEGEIGESHHPETHLIPLLLQTVLKKQSHFTLYGDDHGTPDGTPIRDFIHVSDLATSHVASLRWMMKHQENLELNIGTGKGYSIREVMQRIEFLLGVQIPIIKGKKYDGDPPILIADNRKVKETLEWTPKYSDLDQMIQTAWNFAK